MTTFTEENIEAFLDHNPRFIQDDFNLGLLRVYIEHMKRQGQELSIEALAGHIRANSASFHWLRDEREIASAVAAAAPRPEPLPKLKGLTIAEKLAQVGVTASQHLSHADRRDNDQKHLSAVEQMTKEIARINSEKQRRGAIAEARGTVVYRPGPGGRVDHGATETARKAALAKLGIHE